MADEPKLDDDGLPDDAAVEGLLENEGKGPLKSLAEIAEIEDRTGKDEQTIIDEAEEEFEAAGDEAEEDREVEPVEKPVVAQTASEKALELVLETQKELTAAIKAMNERDAAKPKVEAAAPEEAPVPAHIQKLLDHDDPAVRDVGEAMLVDRKELTSRLDAAEGKLGQRELVEQTVQFEGQIETLGDRCEPKLTEMEKDWLVDRMTESRNGAEPLITSQTVEQGIEKLFPKRLKAANGAPDTALKGAEGERPVVKVKGPRPEKGTIDDRGGSAGPKSTLKPPPANESLEQAVERGFAQVTHRR